MAGRNRYRLPLSPSLRLKFDALQEVFDLRVLGTAYAGSPTEDAIFRLVPPQRPRFLDGTLFYLLLPRRIARELREFRPEAILTQSPYEAAAVLAGRRLARSDAKLLVDVHGDWRTLSRLYGSPVRALGRPLFDRIAAFAVRRADGVRTVSGYGSRLVRELGREPAGEFPAFMDLGPFVARPQVPLPAHPAPLFVGVLELYKNVDGLADAWRRAAPRLPGVILRIVGDGSRRHVVEQLVRELPEQTEWTPQLELEEVVDAMDVATFLVLPSRSEGMGRVIVEALVRGRPALGSDVGGIPELVRDGENGLLVPPRDVDALASAMVRLCMDRPLLERLAAGARAAAEPWLATPEKFAERTRDLVERVLAERGS
jgi:glycosyltransferase involved in cell wall biosynthesis